MNCPLCSNENTVTYCVVKKKPYILCKTCSLIFVPQEYQLNFSDEKARYATHNNDPLDQRYRKFLLQLMNPLLKFLNNKQQGLDYGCGPGPTLSIMLAEATHDMNIYDPHFFPDKAVLQKKYDFITASEVVEHFYEPQKEFEYLFPMLYNTGILGIMTLFWREDIDFEKWSYKDDTTHVTFYHENTLKYIASRWRANILYKDDRVCIFQKIK